MMHPGPQLYHKNYINGFHPTRGEGKWGRMVVSEIMGIRKLGIAGYVDGAFPMTPEIHIMTVGHKMETLDKQLNDMNSEVQESKKILGDLTNQVIAMSEILRPMLEEKTKEIRSLRMALIQELNQSLSSLKEVRKFFLESDYRIEMDRLKEFVVVCKELQALKAAGTLDAICDSAIRLAVKEPLDVGK